jgi:hypothetical protein
MEEEAQNPYAPPQSDISIVPEKRGPGVKKVFSPAQGALGALLGGPLPGAYFVAANFRALGKSGRALLTTIWGVAILLAVLLWHSRLPEGVLNYSIAIVYSAAAWAIIAWTQFTKAQIVASTKLTVHSNGRVVGIALAGLLMTFMLSYVLFDVLSLR